MMKPASVLLIVLIALFSVAGCGGREPSRVPAPPVILNLPASPVPQRPVLPQIDGALPLEHKANVDVLLERDDIMRALIKALYAALGIPGNAGEGENK